MTIIGRPAPAYADAQVVAIGENKLGVLWRGERRREQYPTQQLATLAIAALRQASMRPHGGRGATGLRCDRAPHSRK